MKRLAAEKPSIFIRSSDGATVIEFALITPLLFLLLAGIVELSMVMFTYSVLEGATSVGSRIGRTGFTSGGTREQYIMTEIQNLSKGLLDPGKIKLDTKSYKSFNNIGKPEPCINPPAPPCPGVSGVNYVDSNGNGTWDMDMGTSNAGGPGDVVVYRVSYPWSFFTPMMGKMMGNASGILNISAAATVRNEPSFGPP